jgi:hypothetical protein
MEGMLTLLREAKNQDLFPASGACKWYAGRKQPNSQMTASLGRWVIALALKNSALRPLSECARMMK